MDWVGGALFGWGSLRTCRHLLAREHISAATMTSDMGLETLWCHGWEVCSWLEYGTL